LVVNMTTKAAVAARVLRQNFFITGHDAGSRGNDWYAFGYMVIWLFGTKVKVDPKFRQKAACQSMLTFSQLRQKSQVLTFGTGLHAIWKIHIFYYLDI